MANTGYGYGVDDTVAASEQLMLFFTQELGTQDSIAVGQALANAKQRYVGSAVAGGFGAYDEKAMIEATLYGLPMLKVSVPSPQAIGGSGVTFGEGPEFSLDGLIGITITVGLQPTRHDTDTGTYYSVGGEVQAWPGRPIQPRAAVPRRDPAGTRKKSAPWPPRRVFRRGS